MGSLRAGWDYAEAFVAEDDVLADARRRATELGCVPVSQGTGAALRVLAAATSARSVIELGTGTGVSGIWLLRGMRPDGVLTTVDTEPEHQRAARQAFGEAGFASTRVRLIGGPALEVLPRFKDAAYDLVFADAATNEYGDYLTEGLRLLRPGGVICFDNALWHDATERAADHDEESLRALGRAVTDQEDLVSALLPVGGGLLAAVKRGLG